MMSLTARLQTSTLATLLALTATLRAQEEPPAEPAAPMAPIVSIDFPGGTLQGFIAQIQQIDDKVNIVVSEMASDITLPALTLRDATVESALRAVGNIVSADYDVAVKTERGKTGLPVHAVMVRSRQRIVTGTATTNVAAAENAPRQVVQVFSIRTITEALPNEPRDLVMDAKTLLSAIDTGLGIDPDSPQAKIRYHKESGMLFVRGTPTQIHLIGETLQSISRDLDQQRHAAQRVVRPGPKAGAAEEKQDR